MADIIKLEAKQHELSVFGSGNSLIEIDIESPGSDDGGWIVIDLDQAEELGKAILAWVADCRQT